MSELLHAQQAGDKENSSQQMHQGPGAVPCSHLIPGLHHYLRGARGEQLLWCPLLGSSKSETFLNRLCTDVAPSSVSVSMIAHSALASSHLKFYFFFFFPFMGKGNESFCRLLVRVFIGSLTAGRATHNTVIPR